MKEQIRSNVTTEQFNNVRHTSEVARRTPRMVESLTSHLFPPTLEREGDIFMPEPGNGEILGKGVRPGKRTLSTDIVPQGPQIGSPEYQSRLNEVIEKLKKQSPDSEQKKEKKKKVSPAEARKAWMEHYEGQKLEGEELKTVNWLIELGYTPEPDRTPLEQAQDYLLGRDTKGQFQRQTKKLGKLEPEQEIVAQRRREAGEEGMPEKNRARMQVDTTGITNAAIRQHLDRINHYGDIVGHNNYDMDFIARQIEQILAIDLPADQQDQLDLVKQRITDLIQGQRRLDTEIRNAQGRYFNSRDLEFIKTNPAERERIFEQIFAGPDSSPGIQFREAFSFEEQARWAEFISTIKLLPEREESERLTREFSARKQIRTILHDANWGASGGGNIQAFAEAAGTYKDEYTDLIFQDPLVESALHFFEQGFQQIKADNNGQLPYEKLEWHFKREGRPGSDLEDMVHEQLINAINQGIVKDKNGNTLRNPEPWRVQSAIVLARGFGVLSLRFPEIVAEARLPEATVLSDANVRAHRTASIYGEAVGKFLDPLEHLIEKFGIGQENRAILYFFLTGDKRKFASKEQLEVALRMRSQMNPKDKRLIDEINFFRTGGPFSHSSWRQRVSFEQLEGETPEHFEKRLERSGIAVLEARVEGDVDDEIQKEVRDETRNNRDFVGKTDRDIESSEKLSLIFDKAVKAKSDQIKNHLLLEKRLDMWKNALKTNPLRVMWEWENKERDKNKNPGQRIRFLAEALGKSEEEAKGLIGSVEKDLMIVQEDFVSLRKPIDENNENLDFEVIERELEVDTIEERDRMIAQRTERRENVRRYVEKIREKAAEGDYRFFKDVLLKYALVTGDPGIDTPTPFNWGFDDIPFGEFDFIKSGGRGMSRKIIDFASAANASTELIGLLNGIGTAQTIDPLIGHLVKIKEALSNVDAELAQKLIEPLAEGVIRIYKKDPLAKLPLGIGTFIGMTGDTSFAQKHKGMGAMSLDETDIYNLTKLLTQHSLVSMEKIEKLRWRLGGTLFHSAIDFSRTYLQLLLLVMIIEFASRTAKGK